MSLAYNDKNIVYFYRLYCVYRKQGRGVVLKRAMKTFARIFLKRVSVPIPDCEALFLVDFNRLDYCTLYDLIYSSCDFEKGRFSFKYELGIDLKNIADMLRDLSLWKKIKRIYDIDREVKTSFTSRLYIFACMVELRKYERALSEAEFGKKVKVVTVLCDTIPDANVVVNYANSCGITTVNCQHGIFITSDDDRSIHYLNNWEVPSKITLTWGSYSANYMKQLNPDMKCCICGNPTIDCVGQDRNRDSKLIGVVFDVPNYKSYNQELLRVVEEYAMLNSMHIRIRLHPMDHEENYTINTKCTEFGKDIDAASCIIGHTTTMIFTYMILGYPVYVFNSELQNRDVSREILFASYDELCNCFQRNFDFVSEGKKKIAYTGEESKCRYHDFYAKLIERGA